MRRTLITLLSAALLSSSLVVPVAAADQPASTPDLLPGVDLVTEEVEPGVFRVVSDGVRDVGYVTDHDYGDLAGEIVVGLDGSVWLFEPVGPGEDKSCWQCLGTFYRLGDPSVHPSPGR